MRIIETRKKTIMHAERLKIYLSKKFKKELSQIHKDFGYVGGLIIEDDIFCSCSFSSTKYFLQGIELVGFFYMLEVEVFEVEQLLNICEKNIDTNQLQIENPVILFVIKDQMDHGNMTVLAHAYSPYYQTLQPLKVVETEYIPGVLLRATGQLPLVFEVTPEPETLKENMETAFERLRTGFQNQIAAFLLQDSKYILHSSSSADDSKSCKDLLNLAQESDPVEKLKFKKYKEKKPLNFSILIHTSGKAALDNTFDHSIVIHCQRRKFQCASLNIPLDVVAVCHDSSSVSEMYELLNLSIEQQLMKMNHCLLNYISEVATPVPHHFYPEFFECPITVIYPSTKTDEELESYRKILHEEFLLPLDKPFLKKLNACNFTSINSSGHLLNPHESINYTGVSGGKVSLVQGKYSYHHYMQDHINDDGWGCAYRSLQTIVSWFKHQGYTSKSIPTHKEIQQALVDVGDKQESFVGSKQWIGSQEVSFCLDHLIKVQSKIMFVSSGAEMISKGRDLYNHFRDQGTPVMIGGGVLAHTILGVDFNPETGDLKYLILDPHFTGNEDLTVILNKGWCGWKGSQFWNQTAFYNLCLPQRPLQI